MVIRNSERGNDLTKRTVNVYTLEELGSCRVEQMIGGIRDFALIVQAYHDANGEGNGEGGEDSIAQLANDVLGDIEVLIEAVHNQSVNRHVVALLALSLGHRVERLEWMWRHSDATRKGYARKAHEETAQRKGAAANKQKSLQRFRQVAARLRKEFSEDQLKVLSTSALARSLGPGSKRHDVKQARKLGLIPVRREM
jgi:hypothetical protein